MLEAHRVFALSVSVGFALATACGGTDRVPTDGGTGDAADTAVGDTGADTGGDVDSAIIPPPDGVLRTSRVWADNYAFGTIEAGAAGAQLFDQDPSPVSSSVEDLGGGCVARTSQLLVEPGMGAFPQYADAGDIQIEGGRVPIDIVQTGSPFYDAVTTDVSLWDGGATLTISAAGGADVAGFTATVEAPAVVQVTSPTLPLGMAPPVRVDRAEDLTVTWMGAAGGEELAVRVIGPEVEREPNVTIECRFDPAAGTGTVPSSALSMISRVGMGVLTVDVVSERMVPAGEWGAVSIEIAAPGVWTTGNRYLATLDIQ